MPAGYLLIDKPAGMTSHDVINRVRRITHERTVGHAGTLDPFATGLLIVAVGREATKHLEKYVGMDKTYEAEICLGMASATFDPEGPVTDAPCPSITNNALVEAMQKLTGDLLQIPPMHSAIKIGGKKLYELARKGVEIERPPRPVTVLSFQLMNAPKPIYSLPTTIQAKIHCSSGTYIRAIARDLGALLSTAGYLTALRRTRIGDFSIDESRKLDELSPENWIDSCRVTMLRSQA